MSLSSKQLEAEIQAMESRLANAKITVALEKTAWQKVARKGKSGAKWKGAATTKTASVTAKTSSRSEIENAEGEIVVSPWEWDSLELAQYLQAKQLAPYAQLVVYEHITGKLLLTTAPGKLRTLFDGIVAGKNDPTWKLFLRVCSQLHKLQKSMDPSRCGGQQDEDTASKPRASPPPPSMQSCGTVFPLISPRIPAARAASSLSTKPQRPQPPPPMASLVIGDADGNRLKTPAPQGRKALRSANHHHGHAQQQMVTCWNCSARFPRSMPATSSYRSLLPTASATSSKAITTKLFCSKACQDAIESSDMSVSASLRLAVPLDSTPHLQAAPKAAPPPNDPATTALATVVKSPRGSCHISAASSSFDFLQVTHTGPQAPSGFPHEMPGVSRSLRGRKRVPSSNSSGSHSPVASITAVRCLSDDVVPAQFLLHGARSSSRLEPRVIQQSRYKLDPELFHAYGIGWAACFDATVPLSPMRAMGRSHDVRIANLETLVAFMSTKAVYRLSLTSRKWFELVHTHAATVDRVWGLLLQRAWLHDDADRTSLRELGFVSSSSQTKRPRRVLMKLTRQLQRTVLDGMKILLNADTWQLAPTCRQDRDYLPLPHTRCQWAALNAPPSRDTIATGDSQEKQESMVDRGNDLYEIITVICSRACEIVAVQAQDLIRPIADDGSTIEILKGVSNGSLWCVACRRLRLFSQANRLPFSEWYLLPDVLVMLEFCMVIHAPSKLPSSEQVAPTTWKLKVLSRLQMQMDKRLLAKESIQQIMKSVQERNAPEQALTALEQFLVRHAPALVGNSCCSVSGKPRG